MELLKSSSEIMPYDQSPLKHIELVARNCYKSEDKIGEGTDLKLVKMLYEKKHHAMLEFYPFYFHIESQLVDELRASNNESYINGDLIIDSSYSPAYASCNLRTAIMINKDTGYLGESIITKYPELAFLFTTIDYRDYTKVVTENDISPFLRYLTARFICDRGVSHELVRHRMCSFAQESTRYCNYGKQDHVKFIIPSWIESLNTGIQLAQYIQDPNYLDNLPQDVIQWLTNIMESEVGYNNLIKVYKYSPQQARSVLPNSLKTEIIVQARLSEWKHIFDQRCSKAAHPDMSALMIPFREKVLALDKSIVNYYME